MVIWSSVLVALPGCRQVVVLQVDVQVGKDQLLLDEFPDDPGHFIAIKLDDGVFYLDPAHGAVLSMKMPGPGVSTARLDRIPAGRWGAPGKAITL